VAPKQRLGKGLEALLPADLPGEKDPQAGNERLLPLEKLLPNPGQPRKTFDQEALKELADSIREHGVIQPVIAEAAGDGTYIIIAGERRARAARLAGLREIPVVIRNYSDEKRMEVSLVENIQRTDLNPIEEAAAYRALMDLTGLSQDETALKVGKNRSTVANALRLLKLPPHMREALEKGTISSGHARAILSISDAAAQEALFRRIAAQGISVREAEKAAAALVPKPAPGNKTSRREAELAAMEQRFIEALGTKVRIEGNLKRGRILIDYYSMDDLDRLYRILNT
jgi:ParB family chromosome partitioning protein